jgi:rod shape determining protein RodA
MEKYDVFQIAAIFLLLAIGLTVVNSVFPAVFWQQLVFSVISLGVYFIFSKVDYRIFSSLFVPMYIASLVALIMPFIFGTVSRGSLRWIILGPVYIQTSEIVKPIIILAFSSLVARFSRPLSIPAILVTVVLYSVLAGLVLLQPDLGSTIVMTVGFASILLAGGIRFKYLIATIIAALILLPIGVASLHDYQRDRLHVFIDPYSDPLGKGYNTIQSTIAVGSGGIWGRGLGQGTQSHLRFLPENHTDFIFASLSEELGLVGALILLSTYTLLFVRIFLTAVRSNSRLGILIGLAILGTLEFQTILNISMNIGMAPIAGVTLPLVSYGGSSLISTLALLGIVQNIYGSSRSRPSSFTIK